MISKSFKMILISWNLEGQASDEWRLLESGMKKRWKQESDGEFKNRT